MKKVLVTGGSGFIGSYLIKKLLLNNYKVNCFDLKNNISFKSNNFKFFKGNILDKKALNNASMNCDIIIHLAASLGVKNTDDNLAQCLDLNILGTKNALETAKENKIKYFLYFSSSEIYGDQKSFPIYESFASQNRSVYAISKIAAENYVKGYFQKYNIKYNIIRFFNVYGPGQKENFVISKYIDLASRNKTLNVYGNGNQIRSFCHVDDATNGVLEVIENGKSNTIYNVGNDKEPITMLKLSKLVASIFKRKIKIQKIPYSKSDRKADREIIKRIPSIKRVSEDTNYTPNINLLDGLIGLVKNKEILNNKAFITKLGIGTLQFGLNYGIANKDGKLKNLEINKIKNMSKAHNINIVDTANVYGNSENRLGDLGFSDFKLVSKLPVTQPPIDRVNWVLKNVRKSLKKLNVTKLYGMHIHNTKYLLDKKGYKIYNGLVKAKKEGLINKIGVSVYTIQELKKIILRFKIDLVLLPFNIFDQRLIKSNILQELKDRNIEIHTRTTFLQGLLLLEGSKIPSKFKKYKKYFDNWNKIQKKIKIPKFEICLKYALSNKYIDKVIVGIDNSKQFNLLIKAAGYLKIQSKSIDASKEIDLINPSKW
jgi:nucleoside-diphosphate-sugar epimerase/aryl-alcohol dehydrogenase-like predicted oxidoreductase